MAEEKKKKTTNTTKKVNTNKKTSTHKNNNQKKPATKNTKTVQKKTSKKTVKKQVPKKVEDPKIEKVTLTAAASSISNPDPEPTPIPVVTEEIQKVIEVEVDTKDEESFLEKTLIFDGRENKNLAEVVEKLEEENVVLDDKVIKRSKAKKIAVMVLTALIVITIVGTILYVVHTEVERTRNSQTLNSNIYDKVSNKYSNIDEIDTEKKTNGELVDENYEYIEDISLGQFEKNILEKKDMIVIVTSTTCLHSIDFEPIVDEVFKDLNKKIYRINITSLTNDEVTRFRTYYAFAGTPTIFTIKKGIVKSEIEGKLTKTKLKDWLDKNM